MFQESKFEKDFNEVAKSFPKLNFYENKNKKLWVVHGQLDICDQEGGFWDTFDLVMYVPKSYPNCIPLVKEKSVKIARESDWHISEEGFCCLDIEHNLLKEKKKGINLSGFIRVKVYPYFANQIYKQNKGSYAAGEFKHGFKGVRQFYLENLNIENTLLAIDIINAVLDNNLPERNEPCICGKCKFKKCHLHSVEFLKSVSKEQLEVDLEDFLNLESADENINCPSGQKRGGEK